MEGPLKFKIVVVGDGGVGKTSLLSQYTMNSFDISFLESMGVGKSSLLSQYTINTFDISFLESIGLGIDWFAKTVTVGRYDAELEIWDSSGREVLHSLFPSYYRNSVGVLIVYDITSYESFDNICKWLLNVAPNVDTFAVFLLVGNKSDLERGRQVPRELAEEFAETYGLNFIETSAKKNRYIKEAFQIVADEIYSRIINGVFDKNFEELMARKESEASKSREDQ